MKEVDALLSGIERSQVLNALNEQTGQPLILELPLCFGGASSARIYVEHEAEDHPSPEGKPRSLRVGTLVELTGIGPVRVDLLLRERNITARVLMSHSRYEPLASAFFPMLRKGLTEKGFFVERLNTAIADATVLQGGDLLQQALPHMDLVNVHG